MGLLHTVVLDQDMVALADPEMLHKLDLGRRLVVDLEVGVVGVNIAVDRIRQVLETGTRQAPEIGIQAVVNMAVVADGRAAMEPDMATLD